MKLHLIILLVFLTTLVNSSNVLMVKNFKQGQREPLCQFHGQYLLHGENRCKFIRCIYGPTKVSEKSDNEDDSEDDKPDENQYKIFYGVERNCPYGTAVSRDFYKKRGYGHQQDDGYMLGESRLCTERIAQFHSQLGHLYHDQCLVEAPRYIPYLPPQMFPALYHTDNQVPGSYPNSYPNNYGAHPINQGHYPGIIRFPYSTPYGYQPPAQERPLTKVTEPEVESSSYEEEQSEEQPVDTEQQEVYLPPHEEQQQSEEQQEEGEGQTEVEQTVHDETPIEPQQPEMAYPHEVGS